PARRPEPAQLLERLAALDLTYYDDPGDTELLGTGARTTVLPVSGAAAGAADDARSAEDEESEPAAPGEEDLAERTAVLPVQDSPPTQPIPAEQPTETLPRVTTAQEPVTETLPVTGAPTRALPVVPPQGAGPRRSRGPRPRSRRRSSTPPYPLRSSTPSHPLRAPTATSGAPTRDIRTRRRWWRTAGRWPGRHRRRAGPCWCGSGICSSCPSRPSPPTCPSPCCWPWARWPVPGSAPIAA